MTTRAFLFTALDTLMFRDGRPFNQGDEGAGAAKGVFPPPPPTLVGALRLLLARRNGFPPWPVAMLGDGVDWQAEATQLGRLRFGALTLVRRASDGRREAVFPAPLHLARAVRDKEETLTLLFPVAQYETDLGKVSLPSAPEGHEAVKTLEGDFVTRTGMCAILDGGTPEPEDIVGRDELWRVETRVGIGRNSSTRTANDGELFTASHTRMADDSGIVLTVDGLGGDCLFRPAIQRLGGEHRAAHIDVCEPPVLPVAPETLKSHGGGVVYAALALAPVLFDELPGPGQDVPGLAGALMSACIGRHFMLGGWNSRGSKGPDGKGSGIGLPLPMRAVLPAGSVFFMVADDAESALSCHGTGIGCATEWGFGQVLIARVEV